MSGIEARERCVGCGAIVPRIAGPTHRYMTAAPGCWAMHGQLLARLLGGPATEGLRQLCADTYAVQHPGGRDPQAVQSVAGHLISLYAQLELGLPVETARALLGRVVRRKGHYHWLSPPSQEGARTVEHVLARLDWLEDAAREWAADAWQAWAAHHDQVRAWYREIAAVM